MRNDPTYPIIRLEIDGMKRSIVSALTHYQAQIDEDINRAVEEYCQPENIAEIIQQAANDAIDSAIREEVKNFFLYGEGRRTIAESVKESLSNKN